MQLKEFPNINVKNWGVIPPFFVKFLYMSVTKNKTMMVKDFLYRERRELTLKEYNESRTMSIGILSGREYRRQRRKDKRK